MPSNALNLGIIVGSHRPQSQSEKVARFIESKLKADPQIANLDLILMKDTPMPFWSEEAWDPKSQLAQRWKPFSDRLSAWEAALIVSPEWAGMVPAQLKNFLLYCSNKELAHKPALIVGVSAGTGGAYPINELRTSGYKNNLLCFIPNHVIVRQVKSVMNDFDQSADDSDQRIRDRLMDSVGALKEYGLAFRELREKLRPLSEKYTTGM